MKPSTEADLRRKPFTKIVLWQLFTPAFLTATGWSVYLFRLTTGVELLGDGTGSSFFSTLGGALLFTALGLTFGVHGIRTTLILMSRGRITKARVSGFGLRSHGLQRVNLEFTHNYLRWKVPTSGLSGSRAFGEDVLIVFDPLKPTRIMDAGELFDYQDDPSPSTDEDPDEGDPWILVGFALLAFGAFMGLDLERYGLESPFAGLLSGQLYARWGTAGVVTPVLAFAVFIVVSSLGGRKSPARS